MKSSILLGFLCCLVFATTSIVAQEETKWEKITDISPNKKFAMRITCSDKPEDPEKIDSDSVRAVDIVSLPAKEVVGSLRTEIIYDGFYLVWSNDSCWCAFYSSAGPRVGETEVYNLRGDKFVQLEGDEIRLEVKGDVKNEYIRPLRWVKPGTLSLQQFSIFRGGAGDSTIQFAVRFDEQGKFHVISKRKVPNKPD